MYTPCASVGTGVAAASALAIPSAIRDVFIHMGVPPSLAHIENTTGRLSFLGQVLVLFSSELIGGSVLRLCSSSAPRGLRHEDEDPFCVVSMFGMVPVTISSSTSLAWMISKRQSQLIGEPSDDGQRRRSRCARARGW